jgi:iron complex transport system substrate-binding protein
MYVMLRTKPGFVIDKSKMFLVALLILFTSCKQGNEFNEHTQGISINEYEHRNNTKIKYARLFNIEYYTGYKKITLFNPWKNNEVYYTYLLVSDNHAKLRSSEREVVVKTPANSIITLSTTHIGLLNQLNLASKLIGVSTLGFVYNEELKKRIDKNEIIGVGYQNELNVEKIIDLSPGLIMTTGFEDFHDKLKLVEKAGVPVAYNLEYMEDSPLARAEWIKFAAAFFNCDQLADSIFNEIENKYNNIKQLVQSIKDRPKVLVGKVNKGTWYVPGGNSYVASLLRDAGAYYHWKSDTSKGSIPMSFEMVLENQMEADFWIDSRAVSISALLKDDEKYVRFKAFRNKNVYCFSKRELKSGANDYWETGLVNPQLILADLIKIVHPEILPDHELIYYKKLE